jgi:hypothetical protein
MALCAVMDGEETDETTTGEVVDPLADTPGQWFTIERAADRLACSQRTVWRMIGRGALRRRGVGGRAEVFIPTAMPPVGTPSGDILPATRDTPDSQAELARVLQAALATLERLASGDTVVDHLIRANADALERQAEEIGQLRAERDALRSQLAKRRWYDPRTW